MKILFAGDYCPSGRVLDLFERQDFSYVLEEIKKVNETLDFSVVNFESNVALEKDMPIKKSGPCLKCNERGVEAIKWAGFNLLCLANNHFRDYGDIAVKRTIESAKKNDLDIVGGGVNIDDASKTFYKTIRGITIAIINVCENEFSIATKKRGGSNPLDPIKQFYDIKEACKKADKIFVIVHGGHEHCQEPSFRMKQTFRFFIDAGADVIINTHQHCFLGYEIYNDKPIFYGLGNFCFDKFNINMPQSWNYGYMVLLTINEDISFELIPYEQCKENPQVHIIGNKTKFDEEIAYLNDILADDSKLEEYLHCFYESHPILEITIPTLFNHWNRLRPFIQKHLHPEWYYHLRDYILCESHRVRMEYEIENKIGNR